MIAADYGVRIRRLRETKNLTLEELAGRASITAGYLGRLERGESGYDNPTLSTIASIAEALEIHPALILFGKILTPELMLEAEEGIGPLEDEEKRFVLKLRKIPQRTDRQLLEKIFDVFVRVGQAGAGD